MATPRKILLVDDSATIRSILKVYLLGAGVDFVEAPDAVAGLAMLSRERFDAIVADVRMEPVDGIEFVRQVRSSQRTRNLPVVLLTSDLSPELRAAGLEAGADAFVNKPISAKALLESLDLSIARRSTQA